MLITQSLQFSMKNPCFISTCPGPKTIFSFDMFATIQFNPCIYFLGSLGACCFCCCWGWFGAIFCCSMVNFNVRCGCCWVDCWGPAPVIRSAQFDVPLLLKLRPIWYSFLAKSSKILTAFPMDFHQSLWPWFLFFWNLIALKSAASIPPLIMN